MLDEPLLTLHDHLEGLVGLLLALEKALMRLGRLLLQSLHGVQAFLANFTREDQPGRKWLVLALQADKNAEQVLQLLLGRFDEVILTQTGTRHFLAASELATLARVYHPELQVIPSASEAIGQALLAADPHDLVTIIGSHYLGPAVAEIFKISFDILG